MLHELTSNKKKNHCFEVSSLILCNNNEPFLSQNTDQIVTCYEKWIVYDNQWLAQWLYWDVPKHSSKWNLHQKKVMVSVWWSVAGLTHYSFLGKPLHLSSMLSKLRHTKNCSAYSWHWSTERAQFFSTTQGFKSLTNWATKFCLICHIHLIPCQPTNHFFKQLNKFLQGNCFHNQQEAENAFQEFVKSWSMDFYTTGINILIWQKCVDCSGSYFD